MRENRLYGSEGGGAARSPYPYPAQPSQCCSESVQSKLRMSGSSKPEAPLSPFHTKSNLCSVKCR